MNYIWVLWFIAAVIFFVIEVLTPTFFVVCFGVGGLVAMAVAIFTGKEGFSWQLAAFAIGSLATFVAIRPLAKKIRAGGPRITTNVKSIIGDFAVVVRDVGPGIEEGEVKIRGDFWRARSLDGGVFKKDDQVIVERLDGTLLYVRSLDEPTEGYP